MSQLHAGAKELKLGALTPTRDFNYVLDTVAGFMAIAQCDRAIGEVVNLGSGRETSISDLVHMIIAATGKQATVVTDPDRLRPQESEVDRLLADSSRAKEWAGWEPAYTLEQGLEATSDWVRDNLAVFKTDVYAV
jgi:nucleoside-diphosphate-sugar epimerase